MVDRYPHPRHHSAVPVRLLSNRSLHGQPQVDTLTMAVAAQRRTDTRKPSVNVEQRCY